MVFEVMEFRDRNFSSVKEDGLEACMKGLGLAMEKKYEHGRFERH